MINNIKKPVVENLQKYLSESLDFYKQRSLLEDQYVEEIAGLLLQESTLSKLIGNVPGGQHLVRWMHGRHLLSNTAEWESHPFSTEVARTEFKAHPDHFLIISASNGVAAIKPSVEWFKEKGKESEWGSSVTGKNTTPYNIIAFRRDQQVDPELLRSPKDVERSADPSVMKARMGMIDKKDTRGDNIFDLLKDQIGTLQAIYTTSGIKSDLRKKDVKGYIKNIGEPVSGRANYGRGVEREKIAAKAAQKSAKSPWDAPPLPGRKSDALPATTKPADLAAFKQKLKNLVKPLFKRVGNAAMMDVKEEAQDAQRAGAFGRAKRWLDVAEKIDSVLIAIDTQGEVNMNGPVGRLIEVSLRNAAQNEGVPFDEYMYMLNSEPGLDKLKPFMSALKANLIKANS